jgi:hypothetical protein
VNSIFSAAEREERRDGLSVDLSALFHGLRERGRRGRLRVNDDELVPVGVNRKV